MTKYSQYPKNVNPLYTNTWFKTERHNVGVEADMYHHAVEESINIYGTTIYYYPVSEYNLNSISSLWGEDVNKKYKEKYTLKAMTETENDTFSFNDVGLNKTTADRTMFISKKAFREVTGREDPLPSDHVLWTQNNIVYEITGIEDQDIILGHEPYWRLTCQPRIVEGELIGDGTCAQSTRQIPEDPDECTIVEDGAENKDWNNDGDITENPTIPMSPPRPQQENDTIIVDNQKIPDIRRNSWGNW